MHPDIKTLEGMLTVRGRRFGIVVARFIGPHDEPIAGASVRLVAKSGARPRGGFVHFGTSDAALDRSRPLLLDHGVTFALPTNSPPPPFMGGCAVTSCSSVVISEPPLSSMAAWWIFARIAKLSGGKSRNVSSPSTR